MNMAMFCADLTSILLTIWPGKPRRKNHHGTDMLEGGRRDIWDILLESPFFSIENMIINLKAFFWGVEILRQCQ
jgi:hypothetical protein